MRSGWRIILTIVVLMILLGAICFGVGLLTGGNPDSVLQTLKGNDLLVAFINKCIVHYKDLVGQTTDFFLSLR